jgi:asparagine synthase (glutamine-hydrolysing)
MCGIGGFLQAGGSPAEPARANLGAMAAALAHRGPDGEGFWVDAAAGIGLCHRRLAIVELSPLGAQPMRSASARFTITFNGEIYNYRALRAELSQRGFSFRGGSDTEVLLAAIEQWGITGALQRSRGMFALGVWDAHERTLWLARDCFGEKPLYYGDFGGVCVFGSELKALRRHSAWRADIDRDALALLLRYDFIPAPHTIFDRVRKVRPGCVLQVRADGHALHFKEHRYWHPSAVVAPGESTDTAAEAALERVGAALEDSIRLQMVADVPVGAFLSGGIDSSLIVALMQRASSQPVRTFSIGFEEEAFNEAPFASRVAAHLGTRHTELIVTSRDALEVIPHLARIYDEPFADSSQIPTLLVSKLARRDVTVALSGDAGDELFGGYARYLEVRHRWRKLQRAPAALRGHVAGVLRSLPHWALGPPRTLFRLAGRQQVADRMQERANVWGARSLPELYEAMTSFWQPAARFVIGARQTFPDAASDPMEGADPVAHMMYTDTVRYLPDDILVKVDRAAMSVSLETRVPLLDTEVAAAAWSIPTSIHLRDGRGKWVLRRLLERHVPRELFERPKSGFAIPLERWLRGELKDWASSLLSGSRLRQEGYFTPAPIERRWRQHLRGEMNWSFHLWGVLMFQSWLEDFKRAHAADASMDASRPAAAMVRPTVAAAVVR